MELPDRLPQDLPTAHKFIEELLAQMQQLQRHNSQLSHQLDYLRRRLFGHRSEKEKLDSGQLLLAFAELQAIAAKAEVPTPPPAEKPVSKGHGRAKAPKDLPRKRIEHPIAEEDKVCACCGTPRERIGEEVTEQPEYIPASIVILEHVRPKLLCPKCEGNIVIAELPPQPIEKGKPGPGLLAQVLVNKYAWHMPLARQEEMWAQQGLPLSRSTLCDWVGACADLLEPIYKFMVAEVLCSKVIHTDDTTVPVLDIDREHTRTARLWVYVGDPGHSYVVFDYTPTREQVGPVTFLKTFRGYLQADAYKGYDELYASKLIIEVACWAHCRRKFFDAKKSDGTRSLLALAFIRQLYEVEDAAKALDSPARAKLRKEHAVSILASFKRWLDEQSLCVLPHSPIGEAITYARNQWQALNTYVQDGDLSIDNNLAERVLRCVAIGRNNWMFAGSDEGGRRAAIIYSLIQTCRLHNVEPWAYLKDVLQCVRTHPASRKAELLPQNWKAAQVNAATAPAGLVPA